MQKPAQGSSPVAGFKPGLRANLLDTEFLLNQRGYVD
jgi:hypothetical protein